MARYSHDDPQYQAALREMGKNLSRLLDDRGWNQADLARAAAKHMPEDARFGDDSASRFLRGAPADPALCQGHVRRLGRHGRRLHASLPARPRRLAPDCAPAGFSGAWEAEYLPNLHRSGSHA